MGVVKSFYDMIDDAKYNISYKFPEKTDKKF